MLRTHTQRLPTRLRGKVPGRLPALIAGAALLLAPVTPAQAVRNLAPPPPAPPASDTPSAGDESIPLEPAEPGQITPGDKPGSSGSPGRTRGSLPQIKGSIEQGFALGDQADAAFDAGNYSEAARLYSRALEQLSENESNHVMRSVLLANGVTSYEQMYATSHDVEHLRRAQRVLQEYLRACKTKYGTGCERYPETQESRARLQQINASIEVAVPARAKIPPEIGTAPGGKPYDLTVRLPPTPAWIAPAMAGGILLTGGGAAVIYFSATAEKYGPIYDREGEFGETADTTTGTDTTGMDTADTDTTTSGTSSGGSGIALSPETKGKLLIGFGAFLAAAGIGLVVLSSMRLAKHKRINRQRARTLAVTPTFGRDGGGLALTGRF